jgi:hypothetical protein
MNRIWVGRRKMFDDRIAICVTDNAAIRIGLNPRGRVVEASGSLVEKTDTEACELPRVPLADALVVPVKVKTSTISTLVKELRGYRPTQYLLRCGSAAGKRSYCSRVSRCHLYPRVVPGTECEHSGVRDW